MFSPFGRETNFTSLGNACGISKNQSILNKSSGTSWLGLWVQTDMKSKSMEGNNYSLLTSKFVGEIKLKPHRVLWHIKNNYLLIKFSGQQSGHFIDCNL